MVYFAIRIASGGDTYTIAKRFSIRETLFQSRKQVLDATIADLGTFKPEFLEMAKALDRIETLIRNEGVIELADASPESPYSHSKQTTCFGSIGDFNRISER